jgi:cytochrome c biogenesis protein CcdA
MTDVGLLVAFAAGVLSLLSPCSALLLPSFFAYAFASRTALLARTGAFYGGLLITLVPLGMGASAASALFYGHRALLVTVAGWVLITLGLIQIAGRSFAVPFSGRLAQAAFTLSQGTGWASTVALGAVYGLAGFCSGPVLGAILTVAATRGTPAAGGFLLAVYALGMALPLFLLAAAWDRFDLGRHGWLRGRVLAAGPLRVHTTSLVSGVMFVIIGVIFLRFDGTAGLIGIGGLDTGEIEYAAQQRLSGWLSEVPLWTVPAVVAVVAGLVALRRWRGGRRLEQRQPTEAE